MLLTHSSIPFARSRIGTLGLPTRLRSFTLGPVLTRLRASLISPFRLVGLLSTLGLTVFFCFNSCATPFSRGRFVGLLHTVRVWVDTVNGFVGCWCTINVLGVGIGGMLAPGYDRDGTRSTGMRDPKAGIRGR